MEKMIIVDSTDFFYSARTVVERATMIARENNARLYLVFGFNETTWENLRTVALIVIGPHSRRLGEHERADGRVDRYMIAGLNPTKSPTRLARFGRPALPESPSAPLERGQVTVSDSRWRR